VRGFEAGGTGRAAHFFVCPARCSRRSAGFIPSGYKVFSHFPDHAAGSQFAGKSVCNLDGEAWVTFPDGSRLGPIPTKFDFESGPIAAASALGAKAQAAVKYAREAIRVDEGNRRESEKRSREVRANFEAVNKENQRQSDERQRGLLLASVDRWSIECMYKFEKWTCSYPMVYSDHIERQMHSFRMGPTETDLFIDLAVSTDDEFRRSMVTETVKLLSADDKITAIYIRAQLKTGEVIGVMPICHVRRNPRDKRAFCTNY
jgi:hypothetical protein